MQCKNYPCCSHTLHTSSTSPAQDDEPSTVSHPLSIVPVLLLINISVMYFIFLHWDTMKRVVGSSALIMLCEVGGGEGIRNSASPVCFKAARNSSAMMKRHYLMCRWWFLLLFYAVTEAVTKTCKNSKIYYTFVKITALFCKKSLNVKIYKRNVLFEILRFPGICANQRHPSNVTVTWDDETNFQPSGRLKGACSLLANL